MGGTAGTPARRRGPPGGGAGGAGGLGPVSGGSGVRDRKGPRGPAVRRSRRSCRCARPARARARRTAGRSVAERGSLARGRPAAGRRSGRRGGSVRPRAGGGRGGDLSPDSRRRRHRLRDDRESGACAGPLRPGARTHLRPGARRAAGGQRARAGDAGASRGRRIPLPGIPGSRSGEPGGVAGPCRTAVPHRTKRGRRCRRGSRAGTRPRGSGPPRTPFAGDGTRCRSGFFRGSPGSGEQLGDFVPSLPAEDERPVVARPERPHVAAR